MPGGRPTDYRPEFCDTVLKLEGAATDSQIAELFKVGIATLYVWRNKYPEFQEAIRLAKFKADDRIESALYRTADEGNVTAQSFWLKNRRRQDWQDRRAFEVDPDNPPVFVIKSILDKTDKE